MQVKSGKSKKKAALFRPELKEVIAALLSGEGIENTLGPWTGKLTPEEWNKILAQTGDFHWELAFRIFNFLKERSVLAASSSNEDDR